MTKGQIQAKISEAIIRFEKEYMGRGPLEAQAHIIEDMVLVRLKGVLTPAETHLAESSQGADLIKRTREKLIESARPLLDKVVSEITGCNVKSLHTDISTRTGERVIVFILDKKLEINE
jgi:uncharacterized protein YbcI